MHLDVGTFPVRELAFGPVTKWDAGVLQINRQDLQRVLEEDANLARVQVDLASPGEATRIVHVLDAVQPRVKVEGPGCIFPGFLGAPTPVGSGRTHALGGVAVITTGVFPIPIGSGGLLTAKEAIVDMGGPGAPYCLFSETRNVVLSFTPNGDLSAVELDAAIRLAGLKAAGYLAETVRNLRPPEAHWYSLASTRPSLPRVGYIYQVQSQGTTTETFLYGEDVRRLFPTVIHPNEGMDGALVSSNYIVASQKHPTYLHQNNPVVEELYAAHGKDLNFASVILYRGHNQTHAAKERAGSHAAKLAKLLGWDGAVLTQEGGGNSGIDHMLACQHCERLGVKTSLITYELGGSDGRDNPVVHWVDEADAVVSAGNREEIIQLPAMERALGGDRLIDTDVDATSSFATKLVYLYCSTNQLGAGRIAAEQY